jgi:hypothetical protein
VDHPGSETHRIEADKFAKTAKRLLYPKHPEIYTHMLQEYPDTFTYAHAALNNMVLSKAGVTSDSAAGGDGNIGDGNNGDGINISVKVNVCTSCWCSLREHGQMPKTALANNLFHSGSVLLVSFW